LTSIIDEQNPQHPNVDYAIGVTLLEVGREVEAQPHLKKAFKLARPGPRKTAIEEWLNQIKERLSEQ